MDNKNLPVPSTFLYSEPRSLLGHVGTVGERGESNFLQNSSASTSFPVHTGASHVSSPAFMDQEIFPPAVMHQRLVPEMYSVTERLIRDLESCHLGGSSTATNNGGDHLNSIYPGSYRNPHVGNLGFLERPFALNENPNSVRNFAMRKTNPFLDHNVSQTLELNFASPYNLLPRYGPTVSQNNQTGLHHSSNIGQNLHHDGGQNSMRQIPFLERSQCLKGLSCDGDLLEKMNNTSSGVLSSIHKLITDQHGNHMFQKLLEVHDYEQKVAMVLSVTRDGKGLVQVAKDQYGIYSVKKLIETVKTSSELCNHVTSALATTGVFELMVHPIGSRLVSHCFEHLKYKDNRFLLEAALRYCHKLARHEKGSASLKHCINNSRAPYRQKILNKLIENSSILATDCHGNFVIQFVLKLDDHNVTEKICFHLKDHLENLSMDQFGSYVIQRCLESSGGEHLVRVLVGFDKIKLEGIAEDPCGNYVLQTALKISEDTKLHDQLVHAIRQLPKELGFDIYARNVLKLIRVSEQGNDHL